MGTFWTFLIFYSINAESHKFQLEHSLNQEQVQAADDALIGAEIQRFIALVSVFTMLILCVCVIISYWMISFPVCLVRFVLLSTLQSNLLRCKMVELLLDQSCSQKTVLPMSFKLLLHFLHTSTLAPDPSVRPQHFTLKRLIVAVVLIIIIKVSCSWLRWFTNVAQSAL